jgi:acyl transferase domain-containing protein
LSGTNVHVLVEEAPEPERQPVERERPLHLLCLSAQNETALCDLVGRYQTFFEHSEAALADIGYTAGVGRNHFSQRLAVLAADTAQARTRLAAFLAGERAPGVLQGVSKARLPRLAFVFTGQGAQYVGMGHRLYQTQPRFRATLERCQTALREHLERPLLSVLFEDESLLNNTAYAQPALFALEVALADLWRSWGIVPDAVLGHSIGEYAAACVAGVFGLEEGARLVATRGRLMQALPSGAMAAVFTPCERVQAVLSALGEGLVAVAAENGPANTVISGDSEAVKRIVEHCKCEGIEAHRLVVSHAFHSPLLEPMLDAFERAAAQASFAVPQLPVVSNVTGAIAQSFDAAYWRRQARQPVRFAAGLHSLVAQGCEVFVEIGPHPVLSSLGASCVGEREWIPSLRRGAEDWVTLLEGLGRLYTLGLEVDWLGFERDYPRRKVALPTYPFQRQRCWLDTVPQQPVSSVSAGVRPLLGRRLASPLPDMQFETGLSVAAFPYLVDHRVYDLVVVAGAVHIAMILALASATWGDGPCTIAALSFEELLIMGQEEQRLVHLVLAPTGQCQIFSQAQDTSWRRHVTSEVRREVAVPGLTLCQDEVRSRCGDEISGLQWTAALAQRGITIGPSFQGMQRLWRRDGEALAYMHLPDTISTEGYAFHPALLDACFQAVGGALRAEHDRTYLPVGIGRLTFYHPPGCTLWCHATLRPGGDTEACSADLWIADESGQCVAAIEALQVKQVAREVVRGFVRRPIDTWFQRIDWQPQPLSPSMPTERSHLILADASGLGARLAERLGSPYVLAFAGREWAQTGTDRFCLDPASPQQWQRLLAALPECQDIVHLWSLDAAPPPCTTPASLQQDQERICGSTLHLIQALPETQACRLWLVTRGAALETAAPAAATLWGLGSVIAVEHPELHCVHIDLDPTRDEEALDFLSREIWAAGAEAQLVFRNRQRYVARLVPYVPRHGQQPRLRDTTLIMGGLGGLGLQVARWAVERGGQHVVLVGRRPPSALARQALRELEQTGARLYVVPADVSQATDMERVVALLQSLPPLRGVVHAAGLLADGVLLQQDWSRFSDVFAAKVIGAWLLHQYTQAWPLDFFVLFSSVAAFAGATGQGNYAAGNAFLDALARYRHTQGLPALSINWGRWAEVGMASALDAANQQRLDALGLEPMPIDDCLVALDRALIQQQPQLGVAAIDWPRFVRSHASGTAASLFAAMTGSAVATRAPDLLSQLRQAPRDEQPARLLAYLSGIVRGVLGLDVTRPIEASTPLTALGLDSLMAVDLRNRINADLQLNLTLAPLLKGLDIEGLAALVQAQMTRQEQGWEVLTL